MARVDVVIPCYKYAHYLEASVTSVLTQSDVDVRVLIIDDCSPDDTEAVGRALAARFPVVDFRRHAVNQGHVDTYNEGVMDWARAEYVLLLSADDALLPGALQRATAVLDANPQVTFCHGTVTNRLDPPASQSSGGADLGVHLCTGQQFWDRLYRSGWNPVSTPSVVVRTESQHAVGGYRADLPHTGDLHMWLGLAALGDVAEVRAPQAFHRTHGENMSAAYNDRHLQDALQLLAAFESAWRLWADRLKLTDTELLDAARKVVAHSTFWEASRAVERNEHAYAGQCLALAAKTYPPLEDSAPWRRLVWKRRLGRFAGPVVRLTDRFRRPRA